MSIIEDCQRNTQHYMYLNISVSCPRSSCVQRELASKLFVIKQFMLGLEYQLEDAILPIYL